MSGLPKLTEESWAKWSKLAPEYLRLQPPNAAGQHVDPKWLTAEPLVAEGAAAASDAFTKAWLLFAVADTLQDTVMSAATTKAAWDALRERCVGGGSDQRRMQLLKQLHNMQRGRGQSLPLYIAAAKEMRARLEDAGGSIDDETFRMCIQQGLSSEQQAFLSSLMHGKQMGLEEFLHDRASPLLYAETEMDRRQLHAQLSDPTHQAGQSLAVMSVARATR
jgi:hypothetical protein